MASKKVEGNKAGKSPSSTSSAVEKNNRPPNTQVSNSQGASKSKTESSSPLRVGGGLNSGLGPLEKR